MSTTKMTTGWPAFNQIEGGFRRGELSIFFASTSNIPKTCFTQDLITKNRNKSLLFVNFENCSTLEEHRERLRDYLKE